MFSYSSRSVGHAERDFFTMLFQLWPFVNNGEEMNQEYPTFELFVRESLVTILEHQDEAQGNRDTTKVLISEEKQVKMRYCAISVCKTNFK